MALSDGLIAFWKLGEASGITRIDSVGSNDLADNNTVTQVKGIVGNGAGFVAASSQRLSIADNTDLSTGDIDFTFAIWAYIEAKPGANMDLCGKFLPTGNQREWLINWKQSTDRYQFVVSSDGTGGGNVVVVADNFGAPAVKTLALILVWHDATANTINIQVNNGAVNSLSHSAGVFDGTGDFTIGTTANLSNFWDGRADAVGFWKKVLPASERTQLYNNGHGTEHPSFSSLLGALLAFWKLEESSGTRFDSVVANDLADNNTVTQAVGKVGNAAQFTNANSEFLSIADNIDLSTGDIDFTWAGWVFIDSKIGGDMQIASKFALDPQREWALQWDNGTDRYRFIVSNDGTVTAVVVANNFGSPPTGAFHFIVAWHDSIANTINIQVNNGTVDSLGHTTGVFDSTSAFILGTLDTPSTFWDGRQDAVGFWKRVLTAAERTNLYNGGNGVEHPFLSGPPPPIQSRISIAQP